jgi:hypothetical protein
MIGNWIHPVYDVQGRITVRFEQRGATDKDLAAGLFKKLKVTLKALRLWDDVLTQEFNHQVAETIHCEGEYKERRSERAKRAAETRKRNTPGSKTVNTAPVLVPEQFHEDGAFPGPPIKIKLTKAQMREMHRLHKGLEPHQDAYDFGNDEVGFKSSFYQEHAKKLVMGLQKQIDRYVNEYNSQFDEWTRDDLLNWTNKSPESMRAKEEAARIHGAIRACEGAISEITYGDLNSDDLARNIRGWWEKRRDAELGISDQHQEEVEHESESTIHACQDQQQ